MNTLLKAYRDSLPDDVASVIDGTHPNKILCQMVSSQLDADRMIICLGFVFFRH